MGSPQNGVTLGGPPPPSDATVLMDFLKDFTSSGIYALRGGQQNASKFSSRKNNQSFPVIENFLWTLELSNKMLNSAHQNYTRPTTPQEAH